MSRFVLIGGPFAIRDTPLEGRNHDDACVLGSVFDLDDAQAHAAIVQGAALIPAETYDAIGFDPKDVAKYPNAKQQQAAPREFHVKLLAARMALHDFRAQLAQEVSDAAV